MRFVPALAASLFGLSGAACGGGDLTLPEEQLPASITALAGGGQSGFPGAELPDPLVVRVDDSEGRPIPGVRVAFQPADRDAGGQTTPDTALTDADGEAVSHWVLGDREGRQTVEAEVVGQGLDVVSFTATANADEPEPGPQPSAERSTIVASPASIEVGAEESIITVIVRDEDGAPLAGAVVALSATGDGNVLVQPSGPTGADGVASGRLRSAVPGTKVVAAVVNGSVALVEAAEVTVTLPQTLPDRLVFLVPPSDSEEGEPISRPSRWPSWMRTATSCRSRASRSRWRSSTRGATITATSTAPRSWPPGTTASPSSRTSRWTVKTRAIGCAHPCQACRRSDRS
jgi:hypothetical protein